MTIDSKLDLVLERVVDLPPEKIWYAWTTAETYKHWFCPRPWKTVDAQIDLRPGGRFYTVMESPEGEQFPGESVFLEIAPNRKLVWTNALLPGYRPAVLPEGEDCHSFAYTIRLEIEPADGGAKYRAVAMHQTEEGRQKHEEMGFEQGWGVCLDQLVEYMKEAKAA